MTERQKWFSERVGKRVFRNKTSCTCEMCNDVYENGLIIDDELHADYLCMCEGEYGLEERTPLKYFDTKEEVLEFENKYKQTSK